MSSRDEIKRIIHEGTSEERLALFQFSEKDSVAKILKKFELFTRSQYPRYFGSKSAPFHREMAQHYIESYLGIDNWMELAFRGAAKTSILKLFVVFVILNDIDHKRKFMKILSKDGKNSKQMVTDIYNMIVEVQPLYGDIFEKDGDKKREETMNAFTTKDGRRLSSGTVGQTQRGHLQDAYRPDFVMFEDIEDRESISSAVITQGIILKCDEAITGLAKEGNFVVNGNYISEDGVIEWFKQKESVKTHIVPIQIDDVPTWEIYTKEDILALKADAEDFWGEYMCDPSRSEDKFFDIDRIDDDITKCKPPVRESAGFKYWGEYLPHHRYGIGGDTAEGIGRDSNAAGGFDFTTGELILTYANNKIAPDLFGHELVRVGGEFGNCIVAPERNNTGHATLSAMRGYPNIYQERTTDTQIEKTRDKLGWHTNARTKPQMFYDFRKAYNDGLVTIYDEAVLKEMKAYSMTDLEERKAGLITRHFDLLTSVVIAWQMKNHAFEAENDDIWETPEPLYPDIGI